MSSDRARAGARNRPAARNGADGKEAARRRGRWEGLEVGPGPVAYDPGGALVPAVDDAGGGQVGVPWPPGRAVVAPMPPGRAVVAPGPDGKELSPAPGVAEEEEEVREEVGEEVGEEVEGGWPGESGDGAGWGVVAGG